MVDTRDKRFSMMGLGRPFGLVLPEPGGSFDQGDRQQLAYLYRGVVLAAIVYRFPTNLYPTSLTGED